MSYPDSHEVAILGISQYIEILAQRPTAADDEIVEGLITKGIPDIDAKLLSLFVPSAFAWAILKQMGLHRFPSTFFICDDNNNLQEYPLTGQHYFSTALSIAWDIVTNGYTPAISKELFQTISARSAEINALNSLLNAGEQVKEVTLQPLILHQIDAQEFSLLINRNS